jgi:hypothetical protein
LTQAFTLLQKLGYGLTGTHYLEFKAGFGAGPCQF